MLININQNHKMIPLDNPTNIDQLPLDIIAKRVRAVKAMTSAQRENDYVNTHREDCRSLV